MNKPQPKAPILINLTNHPSHLWDEKQMEASKAYGKILDMPFPAIDPNADEGYIALLADEYRDKILALSKEYITTVHLMGELTFTFALLKRLQKKGIACIASTSMRIVKNEHEGIKDGVVFKFERYRNYEQ